MALTARTPRQEQIRELYYHDLSAKDIGARLGMTKRAVYSHLRAMRKQSAGRTAVCGCLQDYLQRPLEEAHTCPHQVTV